ncbi:MAG: hypothetical protein JJU21_07260 [Salinarimonas sp.]|nr:hypothetical protein [Salinarimonas sp.]
MTNLARRRFLAGSGLIAASAMTPGPARAAQNLRLRMAYGLPRILTTPFEAAEAFTARVAEASDDAIRITLFDRREALVADETGADTVSPDDEHEAFEAPEDRPGLADDDDTPSETAPTAQDLLEAVGAGRLDMAYLSLDALYDREPALAFTGGAPFGLNARQHQAWWVHGGGRESIDEALARHGCIALPCGGGGTPMGGFYPREITQPDDFTGLRTRITGIGAQVLRELGAEVHDIPLEETAEAMREGRIEAAAGFGPVDDEMLDLHRMARFYHAPAFWQGSATFYVLVNLRLWEGLSPGQRGLLGMAAQSTHQDLLARYDHLAAPALRRLVISGIELRYFPQEVMQAGLAAATRVHDDLARRDALYERAYRAMLAYRTDALLWWPVAELSFDSFMARSRGEP